MYCQIMENEERLKQLIEEAVSRAVARFMEPKNPKLISREEAAQRLNVDISTLWRWDKVGYLPVASRIGKHVYYSEEAIKRIEAGEALTPMQRPMAPVFRGLTPSLKK
jgi:predicted DNA-binding transcriptional regulator AlpA